VALVAFDAPTYLFAIPSNDGAIIFWFYTCRQRSGIDQVCEKGCKSADLTWKIGRCHKFLGVGVGAVDGQHSTRERVRSRSVTSVDGLDCLVEQLVY
jgi:hypothetical protein